MCKENSYDVPQDSVWQPNDAGNYAEESMEYNISIRKEADGFWHVAAKEIDNMHYARRSLRRALVCLTEFFDDNELY